LQGIIKNPHGRILDIGTGSGRNAKYIAQLAIKTHNDENNIQVFAVEPTDMMQSLAHVKYWV
jgi:protein-L-isoaspartate O-methyltransferase